MSRPRLRFRAGLVTLLVAAGPVFARQEPEPGVQPPQDEAGNQEKPPQEPVQGPPPKPEEPVQGPSPAGESNDAQPQAAPAGDAPAPSVRAAEPESAAPVAARHPAVVWPLSSDDIARHLRGIVAAHPDVATLDVLGHSAGGREILALRLGVRAEGAEARPILLLAEHRGRESGGPEATLEAAWRLAEDCERDPAVRTLLSQATLVVAPALDPDRRAEPAPDGEVPRFECNFPSGWQPESMRPGSGRVSLSRPETLAAARYVAGLKSCAVLLGFAVPAPRGAPYSGAELPDADREVFLRLGAALELPEASPIVPWFEESTGGGSLHDFAYQARGIYPLAIPLPAPEELGSAVGQAFNRQVDERVRRCLACLPRLAVVQEGLERLASDTWQLDVRIQNAGIVPTSSALARHRDLADVTLRLEGAKLVATAKKPSSGASFTDASFNVRAPLSGGTLAGGEGRWLRLILEAGSGARVSVSALSLWAGSGGIQVVLP